MEEVDKFKILLERCLEKYRNKEIGLAFSGGLDSSVIAKILKNLGIKFKAYVVGIDNSHDIRQARKVASSIGIDLDVIKIGKREIEKAIPIERDILEKLYNKEKIIDLEVNAIPISFNLPLYFVAENAKEDVILVGNGADELFGGYSKYQKFDDKLASKEMEKDLNKFIRYGKKQNEENAKYFNKKFEFPYIDEEIVDFCFNLPFDLKISNGIRKFILRKVAEKAGLKTEIAFKEKKACQYGSGIIDTMKKLARISKHHISAYIKEL